uniref:Uncharacterized protein n=1 Tax=Lutzomyia longipalpis TaxID=7200 RepID=A0A1B0GK47_LUTLO
MSSTSEDSANESNGEELELPETDLEESVIIPRKTGRRMRVMSSSEEDDDPVILSPKTRRSIGIRHPMRLAASDESDSDLLESEDELDSEHSSREPSHIENSNGPEEDTPTGPPRENTMDSRNASRRMPLESSSEEEDDDAASENSESDLEEELDSVPSVTKEMTDKIDSVTSPDASATEPSHPENSDAPEEDTPTGPPRDSTFKEPTPSSFEKSVFGKIQSTPCATGNTSSKSRNRQQNDMKEISKRLVNLDITTDEIILLSDDSTNDSNKQLVSPAVLNAEKQKLEKLFQDQQKTMELYKKMRQNLPDKGAQLLKKNKSIEEEVERQLERISQLSIKEDAEESSKMVKNAVQEQGAVCVELLDDGNEFKEREA